MLRYLTAGESHGEYLVGIIEGIPSGLELTHEMLAAQMMRRKLGFGRGGRQKIETDALQIVSGVRLGKTLGSPIAILLPNKDWENWRTIMQVAPGDAQEVDRRVEVPRPGHADRAGGIKYDHQDLRNVLERASARETAMRVALGTVARILLEALGIYVASRVVRIGHVNSCALMEGSVETLNARVDASPVRCDDPQAEQDMIRAVEACQSQGDTLGGAFEVLAEHVPLGLGSYSQWDRRLEAHLGASFLSLNAIKAVEVGLGVDAGAQRGSEVHDAMGLDDQHRARWLTNRAGGIEGGMSTSQPIVLRATMKPLSTLMRPLASVHLQRKEQAQAHTERSDVCAVPAAAVIGESLMCLTLAQTILEKFGGDALSELLPRVSQWRRHCATR